MPKILEHNFTWLGQINRTKGALISGSPAAYLGIFLKAIGPFSRFFDRMLYRIVSSDEIIKDKLPSSLMIISPPRSGSTITYQVLVRVIPSVYISNLHYIFPNCASSFMLSRNLFAPQSSDFKNYYGYTSSIYDVNEGNIIVHGFLHDKASRNEIREKFIKFVANMNATEDRPLIFKNIRAYNHIALMSRAVPEVVFLRIRRSPEQVIQSTLRAYHELGTFNPVPNNLRNSKITDPAEVAVKQYLEIEREIDGEMEQIKQSAKLEWRYEDFCSETWPMIKDLARNYLDMDPGSLNRNAVPRLKVSNRVKVTNHEARRISILLEEMRSKS